MHLVKSSFWLFVALCFQKHECSKRLSGPTFTRYPDSRQTLLNTESLRLSCHASGNPKPVIRWWQKSLEMGGEETLVQSVTSLREVRYGGELLFLPFSVSRFRQYIHSTTYFCVASNALGRIRSPDVQLNAIIRKEYDVRVRSSPGVAGNSAFLKCVVPAYAFAYVKVSSWIRQDGMVILSGTVKEKYVALSSGELLINHVDQNDQMHSFVCEVEDKYTKEKRTSSNSVHVQVIDEEENSRPTLILSHRSEIVDQGDVIILPCVVNGYPSPVIRWLKKSHSTSVLESINPDDRMQIFGGTLAISGANPQDSGEYKCVASNGMGEVTTSTFLQVKENTTVVLEPEVSEISVGQSVTFFCKYDSKRIDRIIWMKNAIPLDNRGSERHFIVNDEPMVSKLFIEPVESVDGGMYQCIVKSSQSEIAVSAQLTLNRMPPIFSEVFDEQTFQPGPKITLSCAAKGTPRPSIKWRLGGQSVTTHGRIAIGEFYDELNGIVVGQLNISSVRVEDSGYYECIAKNDMGEVHHSDKLNIYGLPLVRPMDNIIGIAGQPFFIAHCNFGGYPIHNIWWTKDGMEMPNNQRQAVYENGSLTISDLRKNIDEGKYMCTVQNKHGHTAHGHFRLTILRLPTIQPFYFMENMNEDDVVQVSCAVSTGDPPFEFRWLKDGKPIAWGLGVDIQSLNKYSSVLFIESLQQVHEGEYTCVVSNQAGSRNHSSILHVTVPPKWRIKPSDVEAVKGSNLLVDCQVTGYPSPTIIWKISGIKISSFQSISSNSHRQVYSNGSLSILNVTTSDNGRYLCQASNGIGNGISQVVNIHVRVPPTFANPHEQKTVRVDSDVVLVCSVNGEQPLTVSWDIIQDQQSIDDSKFRLRNEKEENGILSTLIVFKVSNNNSGIVTCSASNPHGSANKTIDLVIQDYPSKIDSISADSIRSESVRIKWNMQDKTSQVDFFIAQCKPTPSSVPWDDKSVVRTKKVGSKAKFAVVDQLDSNSVYQCRVFGKNGIGNGPGSQLITIRTLQIAPRFAPLSVELEALNSSAIRVMWQAPPRSSQEGAESIDGYSIYVKKHEERDYGQKIAVNDLLEGHVHHTYVVSGLAEFTEYQIKITTFNNAGEGPPSSSQTARTHEGVPKQAPVDIQCVAKSENSIEVKWKSPPPRSIKGVLEGYTVLFRKQSDLEIQSVKLGRDMTSVELQKLVQCSNYSISVAASTNVGDGVFSNALWCQTLDGFPGRPEAIKASLSSQNSITVAWLPPKKTSCQMLQYTVYLTQKYSDKKDLTMLHTPYDSTTRNISSLRTANVYMFWVTASSTIGEGEPSEKVEKVIADQYPPEISQISRDILIVDGETLVLNCTVFGLPKPSRKWKSIYSEENEKNNIEMVRNGSLIIRNASRIDSGRYRCIAEYLQDKTSIEYVVNVTQKPICPKIEIVSTSSTSIALRIDSESVENVDPITDSTLRYRKWDEYEWTNLYFVEFRDIRTKLTSLNCGTAYNIELICMNKYGHYSRTKQVKVSTNGTAPLAPEHSEFVASNGSHHFLRMQTWNDGGCPIEKYEISYRDSLTNRWSLFETLYENEKLVLLSNDKRADEFNTESVLLKVYNEAGLTRFEYDISKSRPSQKEKQQKTSTERYSKPPFYTDWKIILPAVGAVLIVLVVIILLRLYQVKRRTSSSNKGDQSTNMRSNAMQFNNHERRHPYSDTHGEYLV